MEIELVEGSGFCFGVQRAMDMVKEALKQGKKFDTLGPLIHNPIVIEELEAKGIRAVNSLEETDKPTILIRSHGVPPDVYEKAKNLGLEVLDATCPFVRNAQNAAKKLVDEGYDVVLVVGKKSHPEVKGIVGHAYGKPIVVSGKEDVAKLQLDAKRVGIISQTTMTFDLLAECVVEALKYAKEVKVLQTRCATTERRQKATAEVAKRVDLMIVVGGRNSSNTRRLFEISSSFTKAYHIERPEELRKEWFSNVKRVGVTAGASTPPWVVQKVIEIIRSFEQN